MAKLSDIFDKAADEFLITDESDDVGPKRLYSCDAVQAAVGWDMDKAQDALDFLESAGVEILSCYAMNMVKDPQSVRYAWLKLCAQVAREEGL